MQSTSRWGKFPKSKPESTTRSRRWLGWAAGLLLAAMAAALPVRGQQPQIPGEPDQTALQDQGIRGGVVPRVVQSAPLNPDYLKYIEQVGQGQGPAMTTRDGHALGYIPPTVDLSHLKQQRSALPFATGATLPASYDLRALGRVTAVRDQGSCGSCWAFAGMGSAESSLLPKDTEDFSENNLKNLNGFYSPCWGGNFWMTTEYFARWAGPVSEVDDPYRATDYNTSPPNLRPQKHVQDVLFFPGRTGPTDNAILKNAVMTYGGLDVTFYADPTVAYYNPSKAAYYYWGTGINHEVTLVGWDDHFSKANFNTPPPGDGAFLIKNSWGTDWGDKGYFWISYYDTSFATGTVASYEGEESPYNYTHEYQYDLHGWESANGFGSETAWYANVFTAESNEVLQAMSTYFLANGSTYQVQVYKGVTGLPTTGTLVETVTGSVAVAGYRTIRLTQVPLIKGEHFSVVVKLTTPGYKFPLPLSYDASTFAPLASGFVSPDGANWTDVASWGSSYTVALKAFTVRGSGAVAGLSQTSLVFPQTTVGTTSAAQSVMLSNLGSSSLTISKIALSGTGASSFTLQSACGSSLAPNGSCKLTVAFRPTSAASFAAALAITDNSSLGTTQTAPLNGPAINAAVLFAPLPGTYTTAQTVKLTSTVPADSIYYTIDGTAPTAGSTLYTGSLTVSKTAVIKAIATAPNVASSPVAAGSYVIAASVVAAAAPVFSPAAGVQEKAVTVTMTSSTPNSTIYYSVNNATEWAKFVSSIPVTASGTNIKAIAVHTGYANSAVSSATYTLAGSPEVLTGLASSVGTTTATLNMTVNTFGLAAKAMFHWSSDKNNLYSSFSAQMTVPASTGPQPLNVPITGLTPKTTYYFMPDAWTAGGSSNGAVQSFTTN